MDQYNVTAASNHPTKDSTFAHHSPQSKYPASAGFFVMPYHVYILYSKTLDQYYIGQTENLTDRIFRHANSGSKSTKKQMIGSLCIPKNLGLDKKLQKESSK